MSFRKYKLLLSNIAFLSVVKIPNLFLKRYTQLQNNKGKIKIMYNIEKNNDIKNFISSRFLKISIVILGIIFSLASANILGLWEKINPLLANSILFTGLLGIFFAISKCIENKIIPYFLLQYINIWIFFNQDFFIPLGLNFKPHVIIFASSFIITFYYIFTNFKYLWSKLEFKLLFLFFILNIFYALFYSSDFRSSSYIDIWIQNNLGLKYASIGSGYGAASREFGQSETSFLKYISGLAPLISFIIGYMSFYGLKTVEETKKKLEDIVKLFSIGYLSYFVIFICSILTGITSIMFVQNRLTIDNSFTGNDFEGLLLLLFIGFNLYISNFKTTCSSWLQPIVKINMALLALLILLGIKKGTIISFLTGFIIIQIYSLFFKEKTEEETINQHKNTGNLLFIVFFPIIMILPFFFINQDFINDIFYNISNRFGNTETLDVRTINWHFYMQHWADNLSWFTALFGFGTDTSRETCFFLSSMQPDKSFQQPHIHNIYLEYFYNWGLMALLYFLPPLIIFCKNIFDIVKKTTDKAVKLFSAVSLACIFFFLIFFMAESPSMITHITFFSLLGFLESVKMSFMKFKKDSQHDYNKISEQI